MKKNITSLLLIIDRSGSMITIHPDLIGGLNKYISDQKSVGGDCNVSIISFDNTSEEVKWNTPISALPVFTLNDFTPRGSTALLDAIGYGINKLGTSLAALEENKRSDKVIVVIYTDGEENSSKEYTSEKISDMIKHQQGKYSWEFIFLGANQDAVLTAKALNIPSNSSLTYAATSTGTRSAFSSVSNYTAKVRSCEANQVVSFTDADRSSAVK